MFNEISWPSNSSANVGKLSIGKHKRLKSESSLLAKQFKDPDLVEALNNDMLEFLSMPVLAGKDKGEVSGAVIKVDGAYKVFKTKIKKGMKLVKPMDAKSLDALFYLHVYDLALIAYENKAMRKTLKIKKGLFG